MNIFKVLSNGDGSINEPNVSAFLGYLLDQNADHGLGDSFLSRFINSISGEEKYSTNSEYKIFYEQGFKSEGVKDIVDLVLLEYSENINNGKETQFHGFVESKEKIINKIYLIENKIRPEAIKVDQLEKQYSKTKAYLEKIGVYEENKLVTVYITPIEEENTQKGVVEEFEKFELKYPNVTSKHIFWNNAEGNMKDLLIELLDDEAKYIIDPISEFTKQIIKSFIQFIESDFKSEVQEKKEKKDKIERNNYGRKVQDSLYDMVKELDKDKEYKPKELKVLLSEYIKKESGKDLNDGTCNAKIVLSTVNNITRGHYDVHKADDYKKNLFYFNDDIKKTLKIFTGNEDVDIFFKEKGKEKVTSIRNFK